MSNKPSYIYTTCNDLQQLKNSTKYLACVQSLAEALLFL